MELAIPFAAIGSLFFFHKTFSHYHELFSLPNTDIINRNFPSEYPVISAEYDTTSKLSNDNKYKTDTGAYTDKYFNPATAFKPTGEQSSYTALTGNQVSPDYFQHNNMVPFFGGKIKTLHTPDSINESILDSYSGAGSQIFDKKEIAPLFSPHSDLQYQYGMPNQNDFYQSRVIPSQNMANVKPFAEQRVAPGIGLGYTTEGLAGFNSGMLAREQWVDRGVDELRVLTHPKAEGVGLYGHEGPGNYFNKERGTQGIQEKNRPDTVFETGPERYFTTVGIETGPRQVPIPVAKDVSRPETSTEYSGVAGKGTNEYIPGEFMPSHNAMLDAYPVPHAYAGGKQTPVEEDYNAKSFQKFANNRSVKQNDYFGAIQGAVKEAISPLLDILRPSRKENSIGTIRPYQNPRSEVGESYVYNPADKLKATMRQTTGKSINHLNINAFERGAYQVSPQQPVVNARLTTDDFYYNGGSSAPTTTQHGRTVDAEYNQHNNNMKSSTNVGYTTGGNIATFNNKVNVYSSSQREKQSFNRRDGAPGPTIQNNQASPNTGLLGATTHKPTNNYSNMQLDRNNGDVLGQLRNNPFAIPLNRAVEEIKNI